MKNFIKILIFSLFAITTYAQQATEIDSKSLKLPRYANLAAITNITTGIATPTQGMMVYNIETASNWYYNGTAWTNNNSTPYPLIVTGTTIGTIGNTSITGESIVTYPTVYSGPDLIGGTGVYGISDGGIYGIGVRGQGNGPFHVGVSGVSNYRGVQGGSTSGIGVYGNSLNGISGKFEIDSYTNSSDALHAITNGTGKAGLFEINNSGNADNALEGITNGAGNGVRGMSLGGVAGLFTSSNFYTTGGNSALIGHSDKAGFKSIYGISEGNNGQAGVFQIQNSSNSNAALESSTNGTGKAAYFHGTNALETDGTIKFGGSGVGIIAAGKVLTSDAVGNATWQSIPAVATPLDLTRTTSGVIGDCTICGTRNTNGDPLNPTVDGGFGVKGVASGSQYEMGVNGAGVHGEGIGYNYGVHGYSDYFVGIRGSANTGTALVGTNNSNTKATAYLRNDSPSGLAIETNGGLKFGGSNVGTPAAGRVLTATDAVGNATWQAIPAVSAPLNLTSTATTLQSIATGASGFAGDFQITNASNAANALSSTTNGTGKAAYFQGTNALETNGTIKFGGSGVGTIAAGKVLTSDAVGNATWQDKQWTEPTLTTREISGIRIGDSKVINPLGTGLLISTNEIKFTYNNNSKIGYYNNSNEFGPELSNTIKLGSNNYRWSEIWSTNALNTSSDRRLKKNINEIKYGLNEVLKLNAVSYNWKNSNDSKLHLGFIAQDVEKIVPEIVSKSNLPDDEYARLEKEGKVISDTYGMEYTSLIPVLVKAIQEQQRIIESKSMEINNLREEIKKLSNLENRMSTIESLLKASNLKMESITDK